MPRYLRQINKGGIYHIVNRGVEKRDIFLKDQDYSRFTLALEFFNTRKEINLWKLISEAGTVPAKKKFEAHRRRKDDPVVELMAFALMPNHYHLIIREIIVGGITLFMRKMGGYSIYFNKQYERVGPLFQSRYKAVEIKNEIQLANAFTYVHTNPVELWEPDWKTFKVKNTIKAINKLGHYRWSSYNDYIGKSQFPTLTRREFFTEFFGGPNSCKQAVEEWIRFKAENTQIGPEIIE